MVVAFYFRLHLAYFPRPVVAIFARPEQDIAMQKMRTIFPTICIAFLLCACSVGERGVRLDNSGKTEDSCVEAIFEILNESDRDALESLFSDNALSKIDNFDEQATSSFELS